MYIIGGIVLGAILLVFIVFKLMWRVAEPNEALIISGLRHSHATDSIEDSLGFKIITGKGTLLIPGVQTVRRLSLDLREAELAIDCVTHQGIPLGIRGVVIYKVGDDFASIANAARRFLDQQAQMDLRVHNVFAGHLRAIVGNMTVEEMIRDREKLTQLTRESSGTEMEKLGLIVDSLQVQEIEDPTGYIENLGRPHAAIVQSQARIAQASADREATEREQEADALKAEARRASQVKQAGYQAEIDQAAATGQAGRPVVGCPLPPRGRRAGDEGRRARGGARGATPAGDDPQAGRRAGLPADNARQGRARCPHFWCGGEEGRDRARSRRQRPAGHGDRRCRGGARAPGRRG